MSERDVSNRVRARRRYGDAGTNRGSTSIAQRARGGKIDVRHFNRTSSSPLRGDRNRVRYARTPRTQFHGRRSPRVPHKHRGSGICPDDGANYLARRTRQAIAPKAARISVSRTKRRGLR
ncbi:hypothetical protein EVAR_85345_1 [Eumeta japonica]|uniref:Uncharacterized protein n=1 Tax=Eumeta variegata TaxID=151549 RepID=A0A4C1WTV7_EUMVA|nr:hypothetical protein EVAR_85345_1 [Eumeta japonica]